MDPGLTTSAAHARLARDGPNELPVSRPRSAVRLLREVVAEPMFLLLVACGLLYLALGDRQGALMLLGFVGVVMGITFVQQQRTERSLEALRDLSSPRAMVVRDGQPLRIASRELVVGDIVLLAEGGRVPADLQLVEAAGLSVDESLLTGESVPVRKVTVDRAGMASAPADDQPNDEVLAGTLVTQGSGRGRVVATGERSALGRMGSAMAAIAHELTPIQQETARVVRRVALAGLLLAVALGVGFWWLRGDWLQGLLAGLTLAMAVLPEELPVILTLFLGLGAWRLSREKVLARRIPTIELLGAATVLCVDKTGTLTVNRMAVRRLWSAAAAWDAADATTADSLPEALHELLEFAVLASHRQAFDPMETALLDAGRRLLAHTGHLHTDWTLVEDYALTPELLAMSRVWQSPDRSDRCIAAKGAPEAMVDLCHLDTPAAAAIATRVAALAGLGLRVLGVARSRLAATELPDSQHDFSFEFLGLVALQDPLRPDVPEAVAACQAAGIRVVMMTGDHPATAAAIAREAGLVAGGAMMTGVEIDTLDDAGLAARLPATQVFCRVQPEHKLRLVRALRAAGEVVAMTGDGVNDAPALKAADIGVAMGVRGSEVAREAADLVLLTDEFSSIVTAVRHGRRVFANLRKAIAFVAAVHVPIVGLSLVPVLLGWPLLLMPVHILFLQLIIDPGCSVVFEAEPLEEGAMQAPPRPKGTRLFQTGVVARGLWQGMGLLGLLLGVQAWGRAATGSDDAARALTFTVLVLSNLGLIWANRSWSRPSWQHAGPGNRYFGVLCLATLCLLGLVLGLAPARILFAFALPAPSQLLTAGAVAVLALLWFEAVKRALRPPAPGH